MPLQTHKQMVTMADDDQVECPLCMEPLDFDDLSFYPCPCDYQICRFCWTKILDEGNGLCPACRNAYNSEKPASFKPLTEEEIVKIRKSKKMKEQAKKQKVTDNKRCLNDVRVVQNNLVFVIGLPCRLADAEVLRGAEYFGKYGKVYKIALSRPAPSGNQNSCGAYVTFFKAEDAIRALLDLRTTEIDRRTLKASLGTTKYCSSYLKGHTCPKPECMYLHELGDPNASFTKEEMGAGKHTEYEERLIQQYLSQRKIKSTARSGQSSRGKKSTRPPKNAGNNGNSNEGKGGTKPDPAPEEQQQEQPAQLNSQDSSQGSNHADSEPMWPPPPAQQQLSQFGLGVDSAFNNGASHHHHKLDDDPPSQAAFASPFHHHHHHHHNHHQANDLYHGEVKNPSETNGMSSDDLDFDPFSESQRGLSECLQIEQAAALNPRNQPPPGFFGHQPHRSNRVEPPPGLHHHQSADIKELAQALRSLFPNANVSYGDPGFYQEPDYNSTSSLFANSHTQSHRFPSPLIHTSTTAPPGLWSDPAIVSSHRELDFHRQDCSSAHSQHHSVFGSGFDRSLLSHVDTGRSDFSHWSAFAPFADEQQGTQNSHSAAQSHAESSHYFRNV